MFDDFLVNSYLATVPLVLVLRVAFGVRLKDVFESPNSPGGRFLVYLIVALIGVSTVLHYWLHSDILGIAPALWIATLYLVWFWVRLAYVTLHRRRTNRST
jgi:hypothetical protein